MSHVQVLFGNGHYRKLFVARTISNLGNGIAPIAIAFGVLALPEGSPTSLSIVLAAQAIPLILVLPLGGVIADRLGRARVIAISDLILSVVVGITAYLFATDTATIPALVILMFFTGILNALWWPAYSGLIPDVVEDEYLQPANAYVSMASNGGFIAGAALGGVLVAAVGSGLAIAVDAISFFVAGLLVFSIRHVSEPHVSGKSMLGDLKHGWSVFLSFRWVVVVVASFSIIVMALYGAEQVMGPVFAVEHYGGEKDGARAWSLVLAVQGAGLLAGAIVASRVRIHRPMLLGMLLTLALPAWLVALAFAAPLWIIALGSFVWGVSIELFQVLWFTALQTNVPREALSRVGSYDAMGSLMFGPIGLAVAGPLIVLVGLQAGFLIFAGIALLAILASLLSKSVRSLQSTTATQ